MVLWDLYPVGGRTENLKKIQIKCIICQMMVRAMEKINTGVRSGVLREERFLFSAGW